MLCLTLEDVDACVKSSNLKISARKYVKVSQIKNLPAEVLAMYEHKLGVKARYLCVLILREGAGDVIFQQISILF